MTQTLTKADGRLASAANNFRVIVWDLAMDKPAQTLAGHSEAVGGVAWSPYGRLASGAVDKRVRTWQPDPQDWMQQACQRAGRNLTQAEWMRYLE